MIQETRNDGTIRCGTQILDICVSTCCSFRFLFSQFKDYMVLFDKDEANDKGLKIKLETESTLTQ